MTGVPTMSIFSVKTVVQVDAPQRRCSRGIVGVERINRITGRSDVKLAHAGAGDRDARNVERMSVDLIVDGPREESAELGRADIRGVEDALGEILALASIVVTLRRHTGARLVATEVIYKPGEPREIQDPTHWPDHGLGKT